jgi:hypothetical protein
LPYFAYATSTPGSLLTPITGVCPPSVAYDIHNHYCFPYLNELMITAPGPCSSPLFSSGTSHSQCEPVEAYAVVTAGPPYFPVFYRCYWYAIVKETIFGAENYLVTSFEWSASAEYIDWWISNGNGNNVPLLCVTNHSPSL